jgi:carbamoyl-phosphate synthase small subunit
MLGRLSPDGRKGKFIDPNKDNLVAKVSVPKKEISGKGNTTIVLLDCGAKENIARMLMRPGIKVIRVPWDYDFSQEDYDGVVLSNGPGDPTAVPEAIANVKKAFEKGKPILGICLGTQLMALAAGASTYKLKYGHRSQNQPCTLMDSKGRCYITSQNHGYAIDPETLPSDWKVWFTNANDGSVEGIRHTTLPYRSVQFHPEAAPGPVDTAWVFDEFFEDVTKSKKP